VTENVELRHAQWGQRNSDVIPDLKRVARCSQKPETEIILDGNDVANSSHAAIRNPFL
jgi:hypothetical protein